jgi:hypothetical protein
MQYLSAENVEEAAAADVAEYPLPYDPEMIVRIKAASMARLSRYQESQKSNGAAARKAQYALIAESVVDENGQPIWQSAEQVERIGKSKTRLMVALVKMIGHHNGGDDKLEFETAEKNSAETD